MKESRHIIFSLLKSLFFLALFLSYTTNLIAELPSAGFDQNPKDTVPKPKERKGIAKYFNIMTDRQQRDSLLAKLSQENAPAQAPDSVTSKRRQELFSPYKGNIIRYIYYNRLKVFGTLIEDTSYNPSKLVRFANKLHFDTREWMLRQSLFFKENDTINAYKLVDNERYLRNLPFIQDARIYVINTYQDSDSVDIVVVTKDLFEYGGTLAELSPTAAAATVYNTNLLGAGQRVTVGFKWNEAYSPQWRTGFGYSKYNLAGTFTDIAVGFSALNDRITIDTGVYERSYYLTANRPLYSSWAKFTGGLTIAHSSSVNIYLLNDTLFRNYTYNIFDIWGGYNFRNQFKGTGYNSEKPNLAVEGRTYNMNFETKPFQAKYAMDPYYNNHRYVLGKFVLFHQDFFKTNYFFGFGKTEDIPLGYNAGTTFGVDEWVGYKRTYTAIEGQKYWFKGKNVISTYLGVGSFWYNKGSQDAVIHGTVDYYSNLFRLNGPRLRQFIHGDYIICPNPNLYKPININRENGIFGYRNTLFNGYQRLNLSTTTNYYSNLSIYGFKFNFFAQLQASLLAAHKESLFSSPLYSTIGVGCNIRNENLAFNTLQFSVNYMPPVPNGPNSFFVQITSVTTLGFNIFALQAPSLLLFR